MPKASEDLISVIIPIYNVEKYLKRCIDSIISQTYKKIEIILVDDGSTDSCPNICDNYSAIDKRIMVIHKKNGGLSDARNLGIKSAKGKYIIFVDGDDSVKNEYVEALHDAIIKDSADITACGNIDVYKGVVIERHPRTRKIYSGVEATKEIFYDRDIDTCAVSKLYKKELFNNNLFPNGKLFEDTWLVPRLFCKCSRISVIPESLYFHFINSNSIVTKDFNPTRMDLYYNSIKTVKYVCAKYPSLEKAGICKIVHSCISTAMSLVQSKIRYKEYEKTVFSYTRKNALKLLLDKNAPAKYKFGALSMVFGKYPFRTTLSIYNKKRGYFDE